MIAAILITPVCEHPDQRPPRAARPTQILLAQLSPRSEIYSRRGKLGDLMRFGTTALALTLALAIAGCEREAEINEGATGAEASATDPAPSAMDSSPVEEKEFAEGVGADKCAILTLEDVSAATGVPASEISQRPISGCIYAWDAGADWPEGAVFLSSVRVHESVEKARKAFSRSTQDVTAEEVPKAKEQAQGELAKQSSEGELTDHQAEIGSAVVDLMPERDFIHQRLSGVGNEAAMEGRSVHIRYGNVTIQFGAQMNNEDQLDPKLATEIGRRIVANLEKM